MAGSPQTAVTATPNPTPDGVSLHHAGDPAGRRSSPAAGPVRTWQRSTRALCRAKANAPGRQRMAPRRLVFVEGPCGGFAWRALLVLAALHVGRHGSAQAGRWGKDYVPNVPVVTQDGKTLNFYDDLIKDKIVVLSFIYTSCKDICPLATAQARRGARTSCGDRLGRDIFFLSISIEPERDTPQRSKQYADALPRRPGLAVPDRSAGGHSGDPLQVRRSPARTSSITATTWCSATVPPANGSAKMRWATSTISSARSKAMDPKWRGEVQRPAR